MFSLIMLDKWTLSRLLQLMALSQTLRDKHGFREPYSENKQPIFLQDLLVTNPNPQTHKMRQVASHGFCLRKFTDSVHDAVWGLQCHKPSIVCWAVQTKFVQEQYDLRRMTQRLPSCCSYHFHFAYSYAGLSFLHRWRDSGFQTNQHEVLPSTSKFRMNKSL